MNTEETSLLEQSCENATGLPRKEIKERINELKTIAQDNQLTITEAILFLGYMRLGSIERTLEENAEYLAGMLAPLK
ncbi:MAG: hypothetical protein HC908_08960 [Calothrix sp. SM1_7_51]|nr:hypothetical protein [Calothrix sp. SM1_7_51]